MNWSGLWPVKARNSLGHVGLIVEAGGESGFYPAGKAGTLAEGEQVLDAGDAGEGLGREAGGVGVVHDTRAILRQSLVSAQLIQRSAEPVPERVRQLLNAVVTSNKSLDQFLGRLSDYANAGHAGSGRPLPLRVAIETAAQRYPECTVEDSENLPDRAVPKELVQLLAELIDNGVKYSGGARVCVRVSESGGALRIDVADKASAFRAMIANAFSNPSSAFTAGTSIRASDSVSQSARGLPPPSVPPSF